MDETNSTSTTSIIEPFTILPPISVFHKKDVGIRAVVGITCVLSIIGSILIIFSYLVQKKRTKSREILAHISVMDFGVAMSNLIGVAVYFDRFYINSDGSEKDHPKYIDVFCEMQAFFALYCTLGSIFWTTALAGYLYVVILHHRNPKYSLYFLRFCYILCYGLAIFISLWTVITKKLGYAPYDSSGWCSVIVKNPLKNEEVDFYIIVFAYDLWVYLAIILIIIFYVAIRGFISIQVSKPINIAIAVPWVWVLGVPQKENGKWILIVFL